MVDNNFGLVEKKVTIPARGGKALSMRNGQMVRIINTHGQQVVDTWAFNSDDPREFMSMEATRATILKLRADVGDCYYSNRRRPILKLIDDSSSGTHDTLMAACDNERYGLLGCSDYHDNCEDNMRTSVEEIGLEVTHVPSPLNLFMNIPWTDGGSLSFEESHANPGDSVTFSAKQDLIIVFSACPQDILPINGRYTIPREAHVEILEV